MIYIYRVNSEFAKSKNLPRDIVVQLTMGQMRDMILLKHSQEPLEIRAKQIVIMKEIPKEIFQTRKKTIKR